MKIIASERKRHILKRLNELGIINLKDIAKELKISEITVRRDFEKLEAEGKLKRVPGGATLEEDINEENDRAELTMKEKRMLNKEEKELIAKHAAALVKDDECVFIDAGTSMLPLMRILEQRKIKIVTYNQLLIHSMRRPAAEIFIIGGQYQPDYCMSVGPVAQDVLKQFYFDKVFIGCSGVDLKQQTVFTTEMESLLMKRIALENAAESYLLLDSSKLGRRSYLKMTEVSDFTKIICNKPDKDMMEEYPDNILFV
jgi:DeoR/GlpR family transcriptional regulator of sugar metabolism